MSTTLENLIGGSAGEDHTARGDRVRLAAEPALRVSITLEVLLYVALAAAALVLHLAQLGAAPLNDGEAAQALAALRLLDSTVPGDPPVAESPLTFALNAISFTFGGATNTAARLPVALGAVLLVLSPVLWRRYLNPLPPLIISGLLLVSPVVLLAGRTNSPVIWSALRAMVLPWCALRAFEALAIGGQARGWMLAASVCAVAMVLLAEPAGLLRLGGRGFGLVFAWMLNDDPETDLPGGLRRLMAAWPWHEAGIAVALGVAVVGTGFFFLPSGLTAVGEVLWQGLRGFVIRPASHPLAFPLWISLRYEFGLVLFGGIAVFQAVREGSILERALAGWFLAGVLWAMIYAGAEAAHALWLTLPLCALVGLQVTGWIVERTPGYWRAPAWSVAVVAAASAAMWLVLGVSLVLLGKRLLLELPAQAVDLDALIRVMLKGVYDSRTTSTATVELQGGYVLASTLGAIQFRLIVNLLIVMLLGVMFFLAGSLWGTRVAVRGFALGTLAVLLLTSFGLGGRAALSQYDDPRELWYRRPVTHGVDEIRATLRQFSWRSTGVPHVIDVTAQVPPDGALAWALREFDNARFVSGVGPEGSTRAVIRPWRDPEPVFGADYVGKDVVTRKGWLRTGFNGRPTPIWRYGLMWLYKSDSLDQPAAAETMMVYIRADVYGVKQVQ